MGCRPADTELSGPGSDTGRNQTGGKLPERNPEPAGVFCADFQQRRNCRRNALYCQAPTSVLIVGDGDYIVYNDKELDQVTHIDYDDIPATMILANNISIDGKKIKVLDFFKDAGTTTITLDYQDKGEVGPITLVFDNNPFALKQWKIVDPQSVEVTVSLYNPQKDTALNDSLFKFKKAQKNPLKYKGKK